MIHAECHSDDHAVEVQFDATPWFHQATDDEILDLEACDWGYDYPADQIAIYMSTHNKEIEFMFAYVEARHKVYQDCGFECQVNQEDAIEFLYHDRPGLFNYIADKLSRENDASF